MNFELVDKAAVDGIWPHIQEWVDTSRGVDKSYSVEDIKVLCQSGQFDLWIVQNNKEYYGFLIGAIVNAPQLKSYYGAWLGGKDLSLWVANGLKAVELYAKSNGCSSYSFIGRKAWQRLLGYDYEGVFYLKNI